MANAKKTALFELHKHLGGKMVPFGGYMLPIQYGSETIVQSCLHTRAMASLFDTSHMGQLRLYGKGRACFFETLTGVDIKGMEKMESRLGLLTNEKGGILDDFIVTVQDNYVSLVVNAATKISDIQHIKHHLEQLKQKFPEVSVEVLGDYSLLALQGPTAADVLQPSVPSLDLSKMMFMQGVEVDVDGISGCTLSRCGYTGEDGFEVSVPNEHAVELAQRLVEHPTVNPAGLGARDALRIEAGLCLYGEDIDSSITPVEASLSWTIGKRRREEGGFLGSDVILDQIKNGVTKKRVGFVTEGAPVRHGCEIFEINEQGESIVGKVTSGSFSPTLKAPIAMGYVQTSKSKSGTVLNARVYGKVQQTTVTKMPFVPTSFYKGPE